MRRATLTAARAVLLAGPTGLAFFAGGFFDVPRLVAALTAWTLVALAALTLPSPLPRDPAARLALAGAAAFTAWVGVSTAWAPLAGVAWDDFQRELLYLGALVAAAALLADERAARAAEPALAAGATLAILYGISERLAPWLVELGHSGSASGRLDQPLTYWNAVGAVAALGIVLCARMVGDETRATRTRMAAAAACAPLGLGLYVTFSRGAPFACAVALLVLLAVAPTWSQLRGAVVAVEAAALGALAAAPFPAVTKLAGSDADRAAEGAVALVALVATAAAAALFVRRAAREEERGGVRTGRLRLPGHVPAIVAVLVACLLGGFVALAARERSGGQPEGATAERFRTLESNRYAYWKVAWRSFEDAPLRGTGSGGFRVAWLSDRTIVDSAHDAHSLYLETLAELGLVGLMLLAATLGATVAAARRALRAAPGLAAGPVAGVTLWAVHAGIDWDREMPAVTLPALVLAGLLLAAAGRGAGARRPRRGEVHDPAYAVPPAGARLRAAAREQGAVRTLARCAAWGARWALGRAGLGRRRGAFVLDGARYEYLAHPHNHTWLNERGLEIPIARAHLEAAGPGARVLEVGNVLSHYLPAVGHEVVDRHERGPGIVNADVMDLSPAEPYDLIVSVSTLEHVGWDEAPRDPARAVDAIHRLRGMLAPGGRLVATIPVGYHPALDRAIADGEAGFDRVVALRRGPRGRWRETHPLEAAGAPYDRLLYAADGLYVGFAGG